jgi:hypothetical protein
MQHQVAIVECPGNHNEGGWGRNSGGTAWAAPQSKHLMSLKDILVQRKLQIHQLSMHNHILDDHDHDHHWDEDEDEDVEHKVSQNVSTEGDYQNEYEHSAHTMRAIKVTVSDDGKTSVSKNSDGSSTTANSDGVTTTVSADGKTSVITNSFGKVTTISADGTTTITGTNGSTTVAPHAHADHAIASAVVIPFDVGDKVRSLRSAHRQGTWPWW